MKRKRAGAADIFRRAGADYRRRLAGWLDAGRLKVMARSSLAGRPYSVATCINATAAGASIRSTTRAATAEA